MILRFAARSVYLPYAFIVMPDGSMPELGDASHTAYLNQELGKHFENDVEAARWLVEEGGMLGRRGLSGWYIDLNSKRHPIRVVQNILSKMHITKDDEIIVEDYAVGTYRWDSYNDFLFADSYEDGKQMGPRRHAGVPNSGTLRFATYDHTKVLTIGGYKYLLGVWDMSGYFLPGVKVPHGHALIVVDVFPVMDPDRLVQRYVYNVGDGEWASQTSSIQDGWIAETIGTIRDFLPPEVINTAIALSQNQVWRGGDPALEAEASEQRFYLDDRDRVQEPFEVYDIQAEETYAAAGYGVEFSANTLVNLQGKHLFVHQLAEVVATQIVQETHNPPHTAHAVHLVGSGNATRIRVLFGDPAYVDPFIEKFNGFLRRHYQGWRGGDPLSEASKTAQHAVDTSEIRETEIQHNGEFVWVWGVVMHKDATTTTEDMEQEEFEWMIRQTAREYQTWIGLESYGGITDVWFKDKREAQLFAGLMNRHFRHREYGWRGGDPQREASMRLRFALDTELIEGEMPPEEEWEEFEKTEPIDAVQMEEDFVVDTLEGEMGANEGDWLAKGVEGELWPIEGDIFEKTYAPTEE